MQATHVTMCMLLMVHCAEHDHDRRLAQHDEHEHEYHGHEHHHEHDHGVLTLSSNFSCWPFLMQT